MKKGLFAIMLIFVLSVCGCENNSDEENKNTKTEELVTTQYDL